MILREIQVNNWACIESVAISDLADGIVVLHGPNRTGKSSLVQALRSTLFDHLHDSQENTLQNAIPRQSKLTPHVVIEFEHAGQRYRIMKTYARTKEGQSILEQQSGGGWSTLSRGKDATKRLREIIGVESSQAGVFQMLWLDQRSFHLPSPRELDTTLQGALQSVLGTLITGRDLDFKERLDKANERWFTAKTMNDKKDSPVVKLAGELEQARAHAADVESQWRGAEASLNEYDAAVARLPELQRSFAEANAEADHLQAEWEKVRERQSLQELAAQILEQCTKLEQKAEQRLAGLDDAVRRRDADSASLVVLRQQLCEAEAKRGDADRSAQDARKARTDADRNLERHQQTRVLLDDRQRLLTIQQGQTAIQEKTREATELDDRRRELEQKLVGPPSLAEADIKALRKNREEAAKKRSKLEADEIRVIVRAKQPLQADVAADGAAVEKAPLAADEQHGWLVRQSAEIHIGDVAIVQISRGAEDRNLDVLARELAELDRAYKDAIVAAQLDPSDPSVLDHLTARRIERERLTQDLQRVRADFAKVAPDGIPTLDALLQQKQEERRVIVERHPELNDWLPTVLEVERLRAEFDEREASLKALVTRAKEKQDAAEGHLSAMTESVQRVREQLATQEMAVKGLDEIVSGADRDALLRDLEEARAKRAKAAKTVESMTLTVTEREVETQFRAAQSARDHRAKRLRDTEDAILRLRTHLDGTEGLFDKRVQGRKVVEDRAAAHQREKLHADAHRHLKELFEHVKQEATRTTFGPINDRVMQWCRQLGLTDYARLEFSELLPEALVPALGVDAFELHQESYGTVEQLSLLIRLAIGGLLARKEPTVAILDDPLAHSDPGKHRKMLDILTRAVAGDSTGPHPTGSLQLIILTCHADRFDHLDGAQQIDLTQHLRRGG
ncbi:MAG: hypothetical protein FJ303_23680 [Planctomycetes bacterium]|nr:hypothetical protein [Planctomycetota bacterium]